RRSRPYAPAARMRNWAEGARRGGVQEARHKLMAVGGRRVWPGRDEKVLTSWNGLMIDAFAQAAQVLDRTEYAGAATRAADFILARMRTPDGRLLRTYSQGTEPKLNGY